MRKLRQCNKRSPTTTRFVFLHVHPECVCICGVQATQRKTIHSQLCSHTAVSGHTPRHRCRAPGERPCQPSQCWLSLLQASTCVARSSGPRSLRDRCQLMILTSHRMHYQKQIAEQQYRTLAAACLRSVCCWSRCLSTMAFLCWSCKPHNFQSGQASIMRNLLCDAHCTSFVAFTLLKL